MNAVIVFQQMLVILILILVGLGCQRLGMIGPEMNKQLSGLVANLFNPAIIISSVLTQGTSRDAGTIGVVFLVAIGAFAALILLSRILALRMPKEGGQRGITELMYIFTNVGFIGIPVVRSLLGEEYVIYVGIFILIYNLILYTYGYTRIDTGKSMTVTESLRKAFLNPGTIASILALIISLTGIRLPYVASQSITYVSNVSTPLALMIIGVTLGEHGSILNVFKGAKLYEFFVLKMIGIPILSMFLLKLVPIAEDIRILTLIMVAMPIGSMPLILVNESGLDNDFCSRGIVMTSILSVITIPLLLMMYQAL